jgi:uncharacterized phage protein (TIGR02220 family)
MECASFASGWSKMTKRLQIYLSNEEYEMIKKWLPDYISVPKGARLTLKSIMQRIDFVDLMGEIESNGVKWSQIESNRVKQSQNPEKPSDANELNAAGPVRHDSCTIINRVINLDTNRELTEKNINSSRKKKDSNRIYVRVAVELLNSLTGSSYRETSKSTRELICARLSEGATIDDICSVIRKKTKEWKGTKMERWLRPATLFRRRNFDQYVGEPQRARAVDRFEKLTLAQKTEQMRNKGEWEW